TNEVTITIDPLDSSHATIAISPHNGNQLSGPQAQTLLNSLQYTNSSANPTAQSRVFTLVSVQDDGGTAFSGSDTKVVNLSSTVAVSLGPNIAGQQSVAEHFAGVDSLASLAAVSSMPLALSTSSAAGGSSSVSHPLAAVH